MCQLIEACVYCFYLIGRDTGANLSADLSLMKSFIETLVRCHGNSKNSTVGMAKLCAIGQLVEDCVLV